MSQAEQLLTDIQELPRPEAHSKLKNLAINVFMSKRPKEQIYSFEDSSYITYKANLDSYYLSE